MNQFSKVVSFFAFPITVLVLHVVAVKMLNLYTIFPNLDIPTHYIGGLSIAYSAAQILSHMEREKISAVLTKGVFLALMFSLTATATVFWEFAEFVIDHLLKTDLQISLANTMQDQLMGMLGGATWVLIHSLRLEKSAEDRISG